jgi:hypothetical protein
MFYLTKFNHKSTNFFREKLGNLKKVRNFVLEKCKIFS